MGFIFPLFPTPHTFPMPLEQKRKTKHTLYQVFLARDLQNKQKAEPRRCRQQFKAKDGAQLNNLRIPLPFP